MMVLWMNYKPIKFGSGLETLLDIYVTCFRYEDQIWEQALPRSRGEVEVLTKCLFICLHGQHTLPRLRFRYTKTCDHGSQYYYICFFFLCVHGVHALRRSRVEAQFLTVCLVFLACTVCTPYLGLG